MPPLLILFAASAVAVLLCAPTWSAPLTTMPAYPTSPDQYRDKWDPFVVPSLTGLQQQPSVASGRQIARDSAGSWLILAERDRQALILGFARGEGVVGGDFVNTELVAKTESAVFPAAGEVTGGSMVVTPDDRLHVIWWDARVLHTSSRSLTGVTPEALGDRAAWAEPRRLDDATSRPGDLMLTPDAKIACCYCRGDTVYYLPDLGGSPEVAAGVAAGMAPLPDPGAVPADAAPRDPAAPAATPAKTPSYPPPRPMAERECQQAVMDVAADGTVFVAFQRDFGIWVAKRSPEGHWEPAERAAWELTSHPAIVVSGGRPVVCYQYEGLHPAPLGGEEYLLRREGGGGSVGFAARTSQGWRSGYVAQAEEIIVNRQGIWADRYKGKLLPMVEEMGPPTVARDRHGVPWVMWQNTTRRWAYCARWLGEAFGEVQELRGPFNAPGAVLNAEKRMPGDARDMGLLFGFAGRVAFDRLPVPTLSLADDREVMFLDCLEVGATEGADFVLNQMTKHPANPILSPGLVGSKDDRHVFSGRVTRHGGTKIMRYSYQSWDDADWKSGAWAVSADGVQWQKVEGPPEGLPPAEEYPEPEWERLRNRGYFDNPDQTDPARKYMRISDFGPGWVQGSKRVQYSPDGQAWTDGPEVSVLNALYEGAGPNLLDPLDIPQRRIKAYGRIFTVNSRSCGMMWTEDLVNWEGAEHFLDPDDPYGTPPGQTSIGPLRGQVFLDACAGKGEDQIYSASVRIVDGLYLCLYWPCSFEHRYDGALAVSRDGFNFTRIKNAGRTLPVGPAGAWDSGIIKMGWPQRDGDMVYDYYGGSSWHHGVEPYRPNWHIGLATMRYNGWTYYTPSADAYEGSVTTIPLEAPSAGRRLHVNVEGAAGRPGAFAVEVLDARSGEVTPGYGAGDCVTLTKDGTAEGVAWTGGGDLPTGRPVRLRFVLRGKGVRLYSFGFGAAA